MMVIHQQGKRPVHMVLTAAVAVFSVLSALLAQRVLSPIRTSAQGAPAIIQATEFQLVGSDGAIIARLASGQQGAGSLILYDADGQQRAFLAGNGTLGLNGPNGKLRALVVANATADGVSGLEVFDTTGTARAQVYVNGDTSQDPTDSGIRLLDPDKQLRVGLGTIAGGGYGLELRDNAGHILATVP